jgi:hypothetical protein
MFFLKDIAGITYHRNSSVYLYSASQPASLRLRISFTNGLGMGGRTCDTHDGKDLDKVFATVSWASLLALLFCFGRIPSRMQSLFQYYRDGEGLVIGFRNSNTGYRSLAYTLRAIVVIVIMSIFGAIPHRRLK